MSLVLIFIVKSQFGPSIFFHLNLVPSVSGIVTPLKGCHVSVLGFFYLYFYFYWIIYLFFYFFIFFKNKLPCVKLSSYHVEVTEWCGSDNDMCHLYVKCHFHFLNLVLYFNFCLNLVPIFVKIEQFYPSPNWNQI